MLTSMIEFGFLPVFQDTVVRLDSLDLSGIEQGWGEAQKNKSVDGKTLKIGAVEYGFGVGTHARSEIRVRLAGLAKRFSAKVGVDAEVDRRGSVQFLVFADGKKAYDSGRMRGGQAAKTVDVDLTGVKVARLVVEDGGDGIDHDHADWAEAAFTLASPEARISTMISPREPTMAIFHGVPDKPEFNGPRIVGATPGHEFIFRIPVTGKGPVNLTVSGLPKGIAYDAKSHVLRGTAPAKGKYVIRLSAKNAYGTDRRDLTLVTGEHMLAQAPPLGWNSWNVWGLDVDADKVRAAADSFIKLGLADAGFAYVNIDDGWEAGRSATGEIQTNKKFGDMEPLASYIHSLGLKLGIYSSPGPKTCGGYEGSYKHEFQDAATYAKWGVDYLKYDWCSYGGVEKSHGDRLEYAQRPYILMRKALDAANRDIVYSLCQYGMEDVYKWGKQIGGNAWRTTGDINDSWSSMAGIGFDHDKRSPYASPGGWNDPDMLVVGRLGWSRNSRPTKLSGNEQITHISLWAMLSSPLLIGCDLTKVDDFTRDLLTNHEILAVNQDPLGKTARKVWSNGETEVWTRPLFDGSTAVAVFNRGYEKTTVKFELAQIGLSGGYKVHDMWTRKDVAGATKAFQVEVPGHGAQVFRFSH